jgi:DNA gyrase subunit B
VSEIELSYGDDDIQNLSDKDWILLRPENHIRTIDHEGQMHCVNEIFDNSIDETEIRPGGSIDILLFLDKRKNTWQVIISDNGRGVPLGKLEQSFTSLKTSGKYTKNAYQTSGGLNGIGGKVAMVLSENFKVITKRENKIGHLVFHRGDLISSSIDDYPDDMTGTMVAMCPREKFFTDVDTFTEVHYEQLVKRALLIGMFSQNTHIVCRAVYESIPDYFWTMNAHEALKFIDTEYRDKAIVLADGEDNDTVMANLREMWEVTDTSFIWEFKHISSGPFPELEYETMTLSDPARGETWEEKVQLSFDINLYLPKIYRGTHVTSIVNNIPMRDMTSSHIVGLLTALKMKLAGYIEDPDHKKFFVDIYRIPLCAALSVKYGNIRFTGLAKDGFKQAAFERRYIAMLEKAFEFSGETMWLELYNHLADDIVGKYCEYFNKPISKKDQRRQSINIEKFYECSTSNRADAELFIVEGVSADHLRMARDAAFQAVFMIKGVPINVTKTSAGRRDPLTRINSFPAYKELIEIIGIRPGQTDLSTARYGKIILCQDADIDGGHIRALHIGALYQINPLIITTGMVYIANPPLYEVTFDDRDKRKLFIRSKRELTSFRIKCLYSPVLSISIGVSKESKLSEIIKSASVLDDEHFYEFCQIVVSIGEIYDELSRRLGIPEIILEKLTYLTKFIQPGRVDKYTLSDVFGRGTRYDERLNILTLSDGPKDISFSLEGVVDALYEELMPILFNLRWKDLEIRATTKMTDSMKSTKLTIVQLYQIFENLNKRLLTSRNKGLGGMTKEVLELTCTDPTTRQLHRITSLGDADKIIDMLGDDSTTRKMILEELGLLES